MAEIGLLEQEIPRKPDVEKELDRLSSVVDLTGTVLETLITRLAPVLRQDTPTASVSGEGIEAEPTTEVGRSIRKQSVRVRGITETLDNVLRRLEV